MALDSEEKLESGGGVDDNLARAAMQSLNSQQQTPREPPKRSLGLDRSSSVSPRRLSNGKQMCSKLQLNAPLMELSIPRLYQNFELSMHQAATVNCFDLN